MIFKKLLLLILIINLFINNSYSEIKIIKKIDDEIITNFDIQKEVSYLKLINPEIDNLDLNQQTELAEISLIAEIIKKKELLKYIDLSQSNSMVQMYMENLYTALNYENESEFEISLNKEKNYTLKEIKEKLKIEIFWNDLIFSKFNTQIKINDNKLKEKIKNLKKEKLKEYKLSEILFKKKINQDLSETISEIITSIKDIGFNNTATVYSISQSSKKGGVLDWVSENSLSNILIQKLDKIKINEITEPIQIGNDFIILKIDDIRVNELEVDDEKELQKLIKSETNKQLNTLSRIYFDRIKINYSIKWKTNL